MKDLKNLLVLVLIVGVPCLFTGTVDANAFVKCHRDFQKIGCFQDKAFKGLGMTLGVSYRTVQSKIKLDWNNYGGTVHSLACQCASIARSNNMKLFSLRFYGECWIGENYPDIKSVIDAGEGESPDGCIGVDYKACNDANKEECIGKGFHGYMYTLVEWGQWSEWGQCSLTCGGGVQKRSRKCQDPDGKDNEKCEGEKEETRQCNSFHCPAQWNTWQPWSQCTKSCETGSQERERTCPDTSETSPGSCEGEAKETRECNKEECPPTWGEWKPWSSCSRSCGGGEQTRQRECRDSKGIMRDTCSGKGEEKQNCNQQECPAQWTSWNSWMKCSKPCGGGSQKRQRKCEDSKGLVSGTCQGKAEENQKCNTDDCPDCNWHNNQAGLGSRNLLMQDIETKESCLEACLWESKTNSYIDGVNFKSEADGKSCNCVENLSHYTGKQDTEYCKLDYGFPFFR